MLAFEQTHFLSAYRRIARTAVRFFDRIGYGGVAVRFHFDDVLQTRLYVCRFFGKCKRMRAAAERNDIRQRSVITVLYGIRRCADRTADRRRELARFVDFAADAIVERGAARAFGMHGKRLVARRFYVGKGIAFRDRLGNVNTVYVNRDVVRCGNRKHGRPRTQIVIQTGKRFSVGIEQKIRPSFIFDGHGRRSQMRIDFREDTIRASPPPHVQPYRNHRIGIRQPLCEFDAPDFGRYGNADFARHLRDRNAYRAFGNIGVALDLRIIRNRGHVRSRCAVFRPIVGVDVHFYRRLARGDGIALRFIFHAKRKLGFRRFFARRYGRDEHIVAGFKRNRCCGGIERFYFYSLGACYGKQFERVIRYGVLRTDRIAILRHRNFVPRPNLADLSGKIHRGRAVVFHVYGHRLLFGRNGRVDNGIDNLVAAQIVGYKHAVRQRNRFPVGVGNHRLDRIGVAVGIVHRIVIHVHGSAVVDGDGCVVEIRKRYGFRIAAATDNDGHCQQHHQRGQKCT